MRQLAVLMLFCRTCNGTFAAALNKLVTKFTIFFVPLFPIRIQHSLTCTRCGTTERIGKTDAERMRAEQTPR